MVVVSLQYNPKTYGQLLYWLVKPKSCPNGGMPIRTPVVPSSKSPKSCRMLGAKNGIHSHLVCASDLTLILTHFMTMISLWDFSTLVSPSADNVGEASQGQRKDMGI